jgi:guanylate kinase
MKRKGIAFIFSSPSGGGKTTLCQQVVTLVPDLKYSISYTTRPPRAGEENGKDYYFVSSESFQDIIKGGNFAEWAEIHGHFYGTPLDSLKKLLSKGIDLVLDIDVQGAKQLKERLEEGIFIFLLPPSMSVLKERLEKRGTDSEQEIMNRLKSAEGEIKQLTWYDYIIINDDLNEAVSNLRSIIIAERCKRERILPQIKESFRIENSREDSSI